jgi:hypothetical protein
MIMTYTFEVENKIYLTLHHAEDAVEDIIGSDYNNIDVRNEYEEMFSDECENYITIYNEDNESYSYYEFLDLMVK